MKTHRLGRRVLVFDRVDSTNTVAAGLAAEASNDGVVVLANEQTAGRGQHGRTWYCKPGAGALLSVLLFPPPSLRRPALLTAWAAVSVCETILRSTDLEAKIKWPNDVLIHERKVCGILIEQTRGTVVGIGLNVNQTAHDFLALPEAGSLAFFCKRSCDSQQIARELIYQLDTEYDRLCQGDLATLEGYWKKRLDLVGKQVTIECRDMSYQGRLRNLSWDTLELELAEGQLRRFAPEGVSHLAAR